MWSKWQWVMRIASAVRADLLELGEDPLRLLAGVDDQHPVGALAADEEAVLGDRPDGEHLDVESHAARSALLAGPDPGPLAFPPHHLVDVIAGRDVEDEHEGAEGEGGADRPLEEEQEQDEEDRRGDDAADDRAAPGRRRVVAWRRRRRGASGPALSPPRGCAGAARRLVSMRPPWVPRCLRRRFFLVWATAQI